MMSGESLVPIMVGSASELLPMMASAALAMLAMCQVAMGQVAMGQVAMCRVGRAARM